ncbi:2,3-diaminopropionate biosynthesis protein SbnB [Streptomyces sp. MZ04]|uniref:2,3-diaminopropionate biosynthesis protein SbnB n=1 Tax=Streptomyces sp. MZ04 TaxID=2559236 RepID=UPI00107E6A2E|nr:2,3-diaminopropionate biosynthesis protein SbnB [Streptomyces sp. MZ04]TGB13259.1 2,3-diaminopropionate biosynthesis protein SbnB [Streptomyces sp. MZ04]
MDQLSIPPFAVIGGAQVHHVLDGNEAHTVELIEEAYRLHGHGETVNPSSYFLRFPDRPASRIIALPASVGGPAPVDGLKWISSFPDNVRVGIPRASAVLILNDPRTGYPLACLESSIISAERTAASAALAADRLTRSRTRPRRAGFFGAGLIARHIFQHLVGNGWEFDEISVFDVSAEYAAAFRDYLARSSPGTRLVVRESPEELVRSADLLVLATVAATPHLTDPEWFAHGPVVLHISLRDLAPEVILAAVNILDDVEHCLKADTSPHLTEQATGGREFIAGTLDDVLTGRLDVPADRTVVFSPFGLGVLDLVLGRYVYDELRSKGELDFVDGFFHETDRHAMPAPSGTGRSRPRRP